MTLGRPIEFNPAVALDAAMQLFWRRGYESSSLQELIKTMGLSKSSFYQTFKSKHLLFQRCIQHFQLTMSAEMEAHLEKSDSGRDYINALFHSVANEINGPNAHRGCLLMNTASEFSQTDSEIAKLVSSSIEKFIDLFETAIKQAQQQGEIPSSKNSRALATYLASSMGGLRNMVKAGADQKTAKKIADITLSALD